ncbi:PotD/PotF family extracellular solute-binding protein [Elstera sp.]|jgi:spermidine/putrescine transport system substrate-binding protein|uniref:PotD/PotF family extracellular solute-binding protein n=1 Tax=Elstera sp. TaxID=1916664 RepID=UPI0037BE849C
MKIKWLPRAVAKLSSVVILVAFGNAALANPVELRVFEWEGYISTYANKFTEYAKQKGKDIKLVFRTNSDGTPLYIADADQIFQAVRSRTSDIVTPTHNYYKGDEGKLLKALAPLDPARLTNWSNLPAAVAGGDYAVLEGQTYAAPLLGGSYALAYNTDRVKEAPTSWSVLLDASHRGRTSVTSTQFEANVFVAAILTGHQFANLYNADQLDRAKIQIALTDMARNVKDFWVATPDVDQMEKHLDYITDYWFGVNIANAKGQNWQIATPKEGETVWLDNISIASHVVGDPAKYEAAHLLIDFMLSPEIQANLARDLGGVIMNERAAKHMTPEETKRYRVGDASFFAADRMWQPMPSRTRNLYRQMWKDALTAAGRAEEAAKLN